MTVSQFGGKAGTKWQQMSAKLHNFSLHINQTF